jgi:predicted ATPase
MIKELKLRNWKSFKDSTLHVDPMTVIIGTNASGKSNALDALLFFQRISSGMGILTAITGDVSIGGLRGGLEWVARKPEKEFSLEVLVETETGDYRYRITILVNGTRAEVIGEELVHEMSRARSKKTRVLFKAEADEPTSPSIPCSFYTATRGPGKRHDLNRSHAILSQVETMSLRREILDGAKLIQQHLRQIFVFDPIPSHMRNYSPFSDKLQTDGANIAGVLAGLSQSRKDEVENRLTSYLKDLPERDIQRVWAEPVGKFKTDAMLYCEEGWETESEHHTVDARGMSDGTLRYLAIVTAMLTSEPNSLLVIEEVDNGLHPSRARVLVKMLTELGKERSVDVIVTTHNPALLDALGNRMASFITVAHRDPVAGASMFTLLEEIRQLPKLMASGTIGRLATEGAIEIALEAQQEIVAQ